MTHPSPDHDESPQTHPLFLPADPSPTPSSSPSSPTPSSSPEPSPSPLDDLDEPGSPSGPRSTSSGGRGAKIRELRKIMRGAVETAGGIAHTVLTARDEVERAHGVWLPDDDDVENLSEPLASLASRRAPAVAGNPDTVDLVTLGMALLGYVMKNLAQRADLAQQYGPPADVVPGHVDDDVDQERTPAPAETPPDVSPARAHLARRTHLVDVLTDAPGHDVDGQTGP